MVTAGKVIDKTPHCVWRIEIDEYGDYMYHDTECGHAFRFSDTKAQAVGAVSKNEWKYCAWCGELIKEIGEG